MCVCVCIFIFIYLYTLSQCLAAIIYTPSHHWLNNSEDNKYDNVGLPPIPFFALLSASFPVSPQAMSLSDLCVSIILPDRTWMGGLEKFPIATGPLESPHHHANAHPLCPEWAPSLLRDILHNRVVFYHSTT